MKSDLMKTILVGFVVLSLIITAIVIGSKKSTDDMPLMAPAAPIEPEKPFVVPPAPVEPEKAYSASYIRGYQDGYSGAWLAPAQWMVIGEYRAGHHAGRQDRAAGKPNKFSK